MKETCRHQHLVLLPAEKPRLQCTRCHLTIAADELREHYCPECFAESGKKHYDFDRVAAKDKQMARYQCEQCGVIIEVQ